MGKMRWPNPALISSAISRTTSVSSSMAALSLQGVFVVWCGGGESIFLGGRWCCVVLWWWVYV